VTSEVKAVVVAGRRLQVSAYDRASSLLLALLTIFGTMAVVLFFLWLSNLGPAAADEAKQEADLPMYEVNPEGEGGGDGRAAGPLQLDVATDDIVPSEKDATDVEENLSVLGSVAAASMVELDDPELLVPKRPDVGYGILGGTGTGRGLGHGPGRPGWPRIWEIMFNQTTLDGYARQLDFFGIELGVINRRANKITCIKNLAQPKPDGYVISDPTKEQRYYFRWRNGDMERADRELVARAGVLCDDSCIIMKFLPKRIEQDLVNLEGRHQGLTPKNIKTTRFGVVPNGSGFKFIVLEQTTRK
jgi:hypothetical protein